MLAVLSKGGVTWLLAREWQGHPGLVPALDDPTLTQYPLKTFFRPPRAAQRTNATSVRPASMKGGGGIPSGDVAATFAGV